MGEEEAGLTNIEKELENVIKNENVYANGLWNEEKKVNTPKLDGETIQKSGLKPVTINEDGSVNYLEEENLSDWYNYAEKKWANAVTKDSGGIITGYFVWIPRYEYKITYTNESNYSQGGTIEVNFIPTSKTTATEGYKIHPSFEDGSAKGKNNNFQNGEWRDELAGFWVAKFPAGWQQNTVDASGNDIAEIKNRALVKTSKTYTNTGRYTSVPIGSISTGTEMTLPVFTPLTYTYNCITIGDIYTLAGQVTKSTNSSSFYGLSSSTDSHMLKNSEWGAVAYLTQSKYGGNGAEPYINNYYKGDGANRYALTGVYASTISASQTTNTNVVKAWYENTQGQKGSSTGNVTGVYDLNGCIWEYVAGYISNSGGSSNRSSYGESFAKSGASTEYATVYPYNDGSDSYASNWISYNNTKTKAYGYGDAILETSSGRSNWFVME